MINRFIKVQESDIGHSALKPYALFVASAWHVILNTYQCCKWIDRIICLYKFWKLIINRLHKTHWYSGSWKCTLSYSYCINEKYIYIFFFILCSGHEYYHWEQFQADQYTVNVSHISNHYHHKILKAAQNNTTMQPSSILLSFCLLTVVSI